MGQAPTCSSACNAADNNQNPSNVLASPMPGTVDHVDISPMPSPLRAPPCSAEMPCGNVLPACNECDNATENFQPTADFFLAKECQGGNCPQPTHVERADGVFQNIQTGEILYAHDYNGPAFEERGRGSKASERRLSQGSQRHSLNRLSQAQQNNLIVAPAMEAPRESMNKAEEALEKTEEPAEEAPKKEKKKRRFRLRRKKKGKLGRDEGRW